MNLSHRLLSSALLAGAVLSIASLPLTTLGSKSVTVQLEERPVFVGQLRELASPYLALATGVSLGVGAVSLAISSWQQAARKLERSEAEIAVLKQQLNDKNALMERLRFSDTRLQSSGLEQFLQAEETIALRSTSTPASTSASTPQTSRQFTRPEIPQTVPNFDRPVVIPSKFSTTGLEFFLDDDETNLDQVTLDQVTLSKRTESAASKTAHPVPPKPVRVSTYSDFSDFTIQPITEPAITEPVKIEAVSSLPAAQSFRGFVRPDSTCETASAARPDHQTESSTQLNELLGHLKQVMTQIEQLHTSQLPSSRKRL